MECITPQSGLAMSTKPMMGATCKPKKKAVSVTSTTYTFRMNNNTGEVVLIDVNSILKKNPFET
ncbi:hypothetical protein E1176_17950 [Fulvivirga sp. RKSG066]|uniref:hypothetical protein n=1 Tax=Fulvivirga aurantia TaxID=2529383 RepID=UPI00162799BB|nr:hypothetical protein [Fulvivirga aurantia]MTI22921.1 hypothetical protein [Fulvivirga aurantia]